MIQIKAFVFNNFQVNTYLLYDESKEAVIMDPACDSADELEEIFTFIEGNQLKPRFIANTHGHIDHVLGVSALMEKYNIPFYMHQGDEFLLNAAPQSAMMYGFSLNKSPKPTKFITEDETLKFGNSELRLFHIPGHSPGSIVFYSETDRFVIVGDVLFRGSIGRTDLPGGSYEELISGINSKLLTLPPDTVVLSGHGPYSTIQAEHDTNPFLN